MRKWKKVVLSITAVIMVVFIAVGIYNCIELVGVNWWYYRLYAGDRITINLTAEIDGKQIKADAIKANISNIYNDEEYEIGNRISVKDKNDHVTFSIRANGYGDYHINVRICDYSFMLNAYQWNWWDVQNTKLYIGIDTKKNEYTTHEEYSNISEPMGYVVVKDSDPKATYEIGDINYISVGCKG